MHFELEIQKLDFFLKSFDWAGIYFPGLKSVKPTKCCVCQAGVREKYANGGPFTLEKAFFKLQAWRKFF